MLTPILDFHAQKMWNCHMPPNDGTFWAHFLVSCDTCLNSWKRLEETIRSGFYPYHLLWALLILKVYASKSVCSLSVGTTEKTFRKWSGIVIIQISNLLRVLQIFLHFKFSHIFRTVFNQQL